jgi:hypothetical protein
MKCPHCIVEVNPDFTEIYLGNDEDGYWSIFTMYCPSPKCKKLIVYLAAGVGLFPNTGHIRIIKSKIFVKPITSSHNPVPIEVEENFANDYREACLILTFSPKASAALSRRCLQNILREKAGVKKGELSKEIQQVIESKTLPSHLIESIDAIRNIGNFAAHPLKSTATGEILDVEYGEAEWLLDVLESLFDFYFVQPAILKSKKDELNKKLAEVGKPPMK